MLDLTNYVRQILADQDRPLLEDAVEAAKVDALRAAYVMIWLACAESLKRRFREAQKRDVTAGAIVGQIETKEKAYKSVDKFVLDKAHEYGFLSDPGHTILNHVYEMRCIYGHPYEEAPSQEQVSHAAAAVVEHVLSKPVKLRHGFGQQLLKNLLEDRSYLDDQRAAVSAFAKDIIPRIDDSIHGWLLDKYWAELEELADDSSLAVFFRRGIWFCRTVLTEIGVTVFPKDDWHDRASRFLKTLIRICSIVGIFKQIGRRAQDSLIGSILAESSTRASVLTHFERLHDNKLLSKRQRERFTEHIATMESSKLRSSGLSTRTCFDRLIKSLESHDWYTQNPAVELLSSNGPDDAAELPEKQQMELGRNVLQAAEGNARSAKRFITALADDGRSWPYDFVRGVALECFINEDNDIRFKDEMLSEVLEALDDLRATDRKLIIAETVTSVKAGKPKRRVDRSDFARVIDIVKPYSWAKPLLTCLKTKAATLTAEEEDDES